MNYQIEDLFNDVNDYEDTCNTLLSSVNDTNIKEKLKEILYNGSYNEYYFNTNICHHDNPFTEARRRVAMASMLLQNPSSLEYLVSNKICFFHGVNANALPSILENGLKSYDSLIKSGINVSTGEESTRYNAGRNYISFTDVFDISADYSELSSDRENLLSFGVIIGTTKDIMESNKMRHANSELPEMCIKNDFSLEDIKVIGVPSDKLEFVKKLVGNTNIVILPMDNINNRLYYSDEDYNSIIINKKELDKLKQESKPKEFSIKELYYLAVTRKLSKIKKAIIKFKNSFGNKQNKEVVEEELNNGRKIR